MKESMKYLIQKLQLKETKKSAISKNNALNYKYVDDNKFIEDKKSKTKKKN